MTKHWLNSRFEPNHGAGRPVRKRDHGPYQRSPAQVKEANIVYRARECLRCERAFESWGAGNRLCPKCREKNLGVIDPTKSGKY